MLILRRGGSLLPILDDESEHAMKSVSVLIIDAGEANRGAVQLLHRRL